MKLTRSRSSSMVQSMFLTGTGSWGVQKVMSRVTRMEWVPVCFLNKSCAAWHFRRGSVGSCLRCPHVASSYRFFAKRRRVGCVGWPPQLPNIRVPQGLAHKCVAGEQSRLLPKEHLIHPPNTMYKTLFTAILPVVRSKAASTSCR